jgi:hypothetical protein
LNKALDWPDGPGLWNDLLLRSISFVRESAITTKLPS